MAGVKMGFILVRYSSAQLCCLGPTQRLISIICCPQEFPYFYICSLFNITAWSEKHSSLLRQAEGQIGYVKKIKHVSDILRIKTWSHGSN